MKIRTALPVLLVFAAACASKPGPAPAPAPQPTPPPAADLARSGLAVAVNADVVLNDPSRDREIPVRVTYPQGTGAFPVIVFSHGAGGSARTFDALARFWATRGFAVLVVGHADAAAPGAPAEARESAAEASPDPKVWEARVRDVSFVVAATGAIEARVAGLKLDESRIGVGGQSLGAFTAMLLAGTTVDVSKKEKAKSFADPLPKAFLLLSPPGKGQQGLTDKSWAAVERPLMVVTGSRDPGVKNQDASWRLDAYQLSAPGDKFAVFLEGATHLTLTGLSAEPGAAPTKTGKKAATADAEVAIFQDVKAATLAFWEAYLKGDAGARAFLAGDGLARESDNRAQLLRR
jgi:dienelactone hydrolase